MIYPRFLILLLSQSPQDSKIQRTKRFRIQVRNKKAIRKGRLQDMGERWWQWSDLQGECLGNRTFKLPNPMYFVPWDSVEFLLQCVFSGNDHETRLVALLLCSQMKQNIIKWNKWHKILANEVTFISLWAVFEQRLVLQKWSNVIMMRTLIMFSEIAKNQN